MIDRDLVMDFAQRAGFGGVSRTQLYTRIAKLAELVHEWSVQQHVATCNAIGDRYKTKDGEFFEGQMDGAYQCAETINKLR